MDYTPLGYAGVIYAIFSGTRWPELRQQKVYGENTEFQTYIDKRPSLIPFTPIYSLAKQKWTKAQQRRNAQKE